MRRPTHNEYGVQLDRNGYEPSIMPIDGFKCYKCQQWKLTVRHEIFGGALRSKSKQYGLWVNVCPACHAKIHGSGALQDYYHKQGQLQAMIHYGWTVSDFRRRFYKNYLDITED